MGGGPGPGERVANIAVKAVRQDVETHVCNASKEWLAKLLRVSMLVESQGLPRVMIVQDLSSNAVREPDQVFAWLRPTALTLWFRVLALWRTYSHRAWDNFMDLEGVEVEVSF
jgi:hypothetical protein